MHSNECNQLYVCSSGSSNQYWKFCRETDKNSQIFVFVKLERCIRCMKTPRGVSGQLEWFDEPDACLLQASYSHNNATLSAYCHFTAFRWSEIMTLSSIFISLTSLSLSFDVDFRDMYRRMGRNVLRNENKAMGGVNSFWMLTFSAAIANMALKGEKEKLKWQLCIVRCIKAFCRHQG